MNKRMRELRGQIEGLNKEANVLYDNKNLDQTEAKLDEIDALEKEYAIAERLFKEEKSAVIDDKVKQKTEKDATAKFVGFLRNGINAIAQGMIPVQVVDEMTEGSKPDGGYTVPEDISTKVEEFRDATFHLQQLVSTETVTTMSGSRTYKARAQQTGFTLVGEGDKIPEQATPKFTQIKYVIKKYAGFLPVTNELVDDSDAAILQLLVEWLGGESRVTRNKLILEAIATKTATEFLGLDDIKKAVNVTLGQAFAPTSRIVTNDDGLHYLDTLKDDVGAYLLQPSPIDPMQLMFPVGARKIPVRVIPNNDLPTDSDKVPFIVGDLTEGIKFYDRKRLTVMPSNVAAAGTFNAFEEDLVLMRGIEREDVVVRDSNAFVNGFIDTSAGAIVP
ncbi:MAG: phage major capsid protein [Peptococcaceae bacterium]|nr:phage major capsid protein [Peptococcaceae bacterium]